MNMKKFLKLTVGVVGVVFYTLVLTGCTSTVDHHNMGDNNVCTLGKEKVIFCKDYNDAINVSYHTMAGLLVENNKNLKDDKDVYHYLLQNAKLIRSNAITNKGFYVGFNTDVDKLVSEWRIDYDYSWTGAIAQFARFQNDKVLKTYQNFQDTFTNNETLMLKKGHHTGGDVSFYKDMHINMTVGDKSFAYVFNSECNDKKFYLENKNDIEKGKKELQENKRGAEKVLYNQKLGMKEDSEQKFAYYRLIAFMSKEKIKEVCNRGENEYFKSLNKIYKLELKESNVEVFIEQILLKHITKKI
jgi:hypothetical protein